MRPLTVVSPAPPPESPCHSWAYTREVTLRAQKTLALLTGGPPAARGFEHLWLLCGVQPAHLDYGSHSSVLHPGLPGTGSVNSGMLV